MSKSLQIVCKVLLMSHTVEKLTIKHSYLCLIYSNLGVLTVKVRRRSVTNHCAVADLGGFQGFHGTPFWHQ